VIRTDSEHITKEILLPGKRDYIFCVIIIFLILISYLPLFTVSYDRIELLTAEDHFYENLQAVLLLFSSGIMLYLFFRSKSQEKAYFLKAERNYFYLLLFLFFFFCFGDEISWGQRIFTLKTPEYLQQSNSQDEISIHNLWLFEGYDQNNTPKTGIMRWVTAARIFALFWLVYCVIIPVLNYLSSGVRRIISKISLPVVPLWLGFLFVLSYIISKTVEKLYLISDRQPVDEIKETSFYFLFLAVCISFFVAYRKEASVKG
jgi:hypothetical protein